MADALKGKVDRRLLPFLMLCYFFAYPDRVNVGLAALTMNRDLGLTATATATAYGFEAGLLFLGYVAFEVSSNLILERVGARLWIAPGLPPFGGPGATLVHRRSHDDGGSCRRC